MELSCLSIMIEISYHYEKANMVANVMSLKGPRMSYHLKFLGLVVVLGIFVKI